MSWHWRISTFSPARCCPSSGTSGTTPAGSTTGGRSSCATAWASPFRRPWERNRHGPRADDHRLDGGVRMRVLSAGSGPALVFLHGPWGLAWDSFLDDLARSFTVYAPEHPGTTPEAHDDIYRLDGLWDLILCHDELLTALKIEEALVVGHSFGGMVACELAAAYPRRVRRLALIDPIGFWRDTDPIVNWVKLSPAELPNYIFRNPAVEAAQRMLGPSEPPDAAIAARVRLMWAMGATSKFIWPIPDKGLKKRIHRV